MIPETGDTAVYWPAADVFCCTSRVESYPLVILEAMAAGLPIITTPVFGISEQVRPSASKRLVPTSPATSPDPRPPPGLAGRNDDASATFAGGGLAGSFRKSPRRRRA